MIHIIALGNPGTEYTHTRHNAAWIIADTLFPDGWKSDKYLCADIRETSDGTWYKPNTFMNKSGTTVTEIMRRYPETVSTDILVLHDDVDIPLGSLRICTNRGEANHNGLLSITTALGSRNYHRIRIGVGDLTTSAIPLRARVLMQMSPEEVKTLTDLAPTLEKIVECIAKEGIDSAMNRFNEEVGKN